MNLLIPMEAGLTGLTVHYGKMELAVTIKPMTAMWVSNLHNHVPSALQRIFQGDHAMNEAITAAKREGMIK